jgi:hypothetical protein
LHFTSERGIPQTFSLNLDMLSHLKKDNNK